MIRRSLLAWTALLAASTASVATAEMAVPQITFQWQPDATNAIELSNEIEALYLALYNSGNLTVRDAELGQPPFVESLMRQEQVMHGAHFPVALDAMMCDLNPDHCRRTLRPAGSRELRDLTAHVGGYVPSRGRWSLRGGETLNIPDYDFMTTTTLERIPAPKGWTPDAFVADQGLDCSAFKASCEDVVRRFNPQLLKAPASGNVAITVPQQQIGTTVALRPDTRSSYLNQLKEVMSPDQSGSIAQLSFDEGSTFSPTWNQTLERRSPADLAIEAIRQNVQTIGTIQNFGVGDEPFLHSQIGLFKLVNHPFARLQDLDETQSQPVHVAVIDSRLSDGHCDLPVIRLSDGTDLAPPAPETDTETTPTPVSETTTPAPPPADSCATIDHLAMSDADHAAGVAGVIASRANGKGMVGMNPHARLWMMAFDRNRVADQQIDNLILQMQIAIPEDVRVANLSFGVQPRLSNPGRMANAMAVLGSRMLIVAAAGNEGEKFDAQHCPVLPACLNDLDNVLTVVGLDSDMDDPGLWTSQSAGSNSNPAFDIGAPAENILSTATGNRFTHQAGTSFAAPQVTAAASLVFSTGEYVYGDELAGAQLSPKIVKDRLIYTSDFFAGLSGAVRAGRLNVGRAINVREAQFELFDGRTITGQVLEAPDEFVCRTPIAGQQFQKWYNLRRLSWNETKQRHFLFRHVGSDLGGRYGVLERDASCLVRTLSAPVEVLVRQNNGPGEVVSFQFRDIRDYTSPLFDQ